MNSEASTSMCHCKPNFGSIHTLGRWHMVHLVIQRLINDRTVLQYDFALLDLAVVNPSQSVFHPLLVITIREVLVCMGASRLLAILSGYHLLHCLVKKVFQLESLDQIGIPDHAAIFNTHILVLLHHFLDNYPSFLHISSIAVYWRILLHTSLKFCAQGSRWER